MMVRDFRHNISGMKIAIETGARTVGFVNPYTVIRTCIHVYIVEPLNKRHIGTDLYIHVC